MARTNFMKKLREKMGVIFFVVAILFIGMMVFQWGMDFTGNKQTQSENIIAVIDGKDKVDYSDYIKEYESYIQNAYNRQQDVDDFVSEDLKEQAWNALINRTILKYQFDEKLTAGFTGKEIYEKLKRNPPEWILNQPQFQQDGKFDYQKYIQLLNDQNADWQPVERAVAANLPYDKLKTLISTITFVTMPEAMDQYNFENTKVRGEFIIFSQGTLDVNVDTSETALKKYYEQHKDVLVDHPYIKYKYVQIHYLPSHRDSVEIKTDVDTVMARLRSGEDFEELAGAYSQDLNSAQNGGELGWFKRGQLIPEFENVAMKLDSGQISDPVLTKYGWHIIRSLGFKVEKDSATGIIDTLWDVQHILFKIEPGYETTDSLDNLANGIYESTIKNGIDKAVAKYGLEVISTPEVPIDEAIPGIGLRTIVNEYAMKHGIGSVPDVVKSNESYFILQVTDVVPKKFTDFESAKNYVKGKIVKRAYKQKRKEFAVLTLQKIKSGEPLDKVANEVGAIYDTTGWIGAFSPIDDYGYFPWINGTLLGLRTPGAVSQVIEGDNDSFYIVRLTERIDADMSKFNDQRDNVRQNIFKAKKDNAYSQWFTSLRSRTSVQDFRLKYLAGETEQEDTSGVSADSVE
ncbi:peptidylprolyl isomerase [bacterium]|nr:peptidylprolyl isomerase [bacterium]